VTARRHPTLRGQRERIWLVGIACALLASGAAAAAYPDRPVKVFLPFPPGGAVDFVSRLVCAEASEILGKPVLIDYRPGAGGTVATDATARSQPDGYSILITTPSHTINPALRPKLPFDTGADFAPVSLIANVPELLVAHPGVPFETLDGMLKYAKANPGKLNYSSAGIGTLPHVTMELLLRRADVQVAHVAYKGAAPALTDLLAGVVQLKYDTYATSAPHLATGKLKVLATAGTTRLPQLPNVPTVAESGFPGYQGYLWIGAVAPSKTPAEAITTLSAAFAKAVRTPKVAERLRADGVEVVGSPPEEFGRIIADELKLWSRLVRDAKITVSE
jgi:tripartite-type tricarboxylate transporter receptor subunit TctC